MSNTLQSGLQDPELEALAADSLAAAEASVVANVLRLEWLQMALERKMPTQVMYDAKRDTRGRPVFSVRSDNGYHESYVGFEDALFLLVDSHRTREEDLESTHQRYMALTGVGIKDARKHCADIGRKSPGAVLEEIEKLGRKQAADRTPPEDP